MNIININSSKNISATTLSTALGSIKNLSESKKTAFLEHLSLNYLLKQTLILLVNEEHFIAYHRKHHSIEDKFQYEELDKGSSCNDFSLFTYVTDISLVDTETKAILVCPERVAKCFDDSSYHDLFAISILYGLTQIKTSTFDKSNIDTFFHDTDTLIYSYLLLSVRILNESLYEKVLNDVISKNEGLIKAVKIQEEEYKNWEEKIKLIYDNNFIYTIFKTFKSINFESNDAIEHNKSIWNDLLSSNFLLKDGSTYWYENFRKNTLAELFYGYLNNLPLLKEEEEYDASQMISAVQYFDKGLFLELFKLTIMFDIHNEFSDDYIRIGKLAYQSEKREYEKNNS